MSSRTSLYFDLLDACAKPGCPVCQLGARAVDRYLDIFSYENVNDLDERARLRAARGFCNRHAWEWWEEHHDRLGIAIVYLDVLTTVLRRLDQMDDDEPGGLRGQVMSAFGLGRDGRGSGAALLPEASCPACDLQREAEGRAIDTLLNHLSEPDYHAAFTRSSGLCVPHLARALQDGPGSGTAELIRLERARLTDLLAELQEYLRKARQEFRHEPRGHEQTSPRRALASAAGLPGTTWSPAAGRAL